MQLPIEMYRKYLQRRRTDYALLQDSLAQGKVDAFQKVGHQLKGNAASFGFDDLVQIGKRMEAVGAESLSSQGPQVLAEFYQWIMDTETRLLKDG